VTRRPGVPLVTGVPQVKARRADLARAAAAQLRLGHETMLR
jgi:hypothetical protein